MNLYKTTWVSCTFLLCSAGANAVELIADDRVVQQFSDGGSNTFTPDTPFANFNASGQNTIVSESGFSGSGSGFGESDFGFFISESTFDITFGVTTDTSLDLFGTFGGSPGDFGFTEVTVTLYDGADIGTANTVYSDSIVPDFNLFDADFDFVGNLSTGTYRLVIDTNITPGGFGTEGFYSFTATFAEDGDGDGIEDSSDNCTLVSNGDQTDTDADGFGNACDPDFNNDNIVNFLDLIYFNSVFLTTDELADLNNDGAVNFLDLDVFSGLFLSPPGPGAN